MTVFDLEKEELGDWFAFFNSRFDRATGEVLYDAPDENAAEFRIRSLGPFWETRSRGRKKEYKMVLNPSSRAMERVGYYEDLTPEESERERDDAWDYAITGIRNAFDGAGNPIECTRENKLRLIEIASFSHFIVRVFQMISEAGIKQKEASEKN